MSRLDIIKYNDEDFELIKSRIEDDYKILFKLDGEFEWGHQITDDRLRLVNPWFLMVGGGLYLIHKYTLIQEDGTVKNNRFTKGYIYHANILHDDTYFSDKDCAIYASHFCTENFNNMSVEDFRKDLDINIQTVKMLLPIQNPSSAYQSPDKSASMVYRDEMILGMAYSEDNIIQLLTRQRRPTLNDMRKLISDGYYYKFEETNCYYHTYDLKIIKEYALRKRLSHHYKVIPCSKIKELLENIVYKYDTLCVGCGSSGSNFAKQLFKTQLTKSIALVDRDFIEPKNLRNTVYSVGDISWKRKASSLVDILSYTLQTTEGERQIDSYECWIQDIKNKVEVEFLFSGVDKLSIRKRMLGMDNIKSRYILDAGYQGLTSSIYVVDREDPEQVEYYKAYLDNAIKNYIDDVLPDFNKFDDYQWRNYIRWNYGDKMKEFRMSKNQWMKHSDRWKKLAWDKLDTEDKETILNRLETSRQTCQSPNIIDIYTITSGILVGVVREIKSGRTKPFTHLEVDTSTGIPLTMVVRK